MTSIKYLKTELETWLSSHPANPKVFFEFTEQMPNLATKDEAYPLIFFAFSGSESYTNVVAHTFTVYCLDRISDDRSNIVDVVSEMQLLMNDIYLYFQTNHPVIDVIGLVASGPLNNFDLDYVGGWSAQITFELPQICMNYTNFGD
jgi:hypothetical protein